jgi:hypothetical protein
MRKNWLKIVLQVILILLVLLDIIYMLEWFYFRPDVGQLGTLLTTLLIVCLYFGIKLGLR